MAFKHWPVVRDVRFAQKCGRFLRGARKRRPDLTWDEFERIARHFKQDDMGSFAERGYRTHVVVDACGSRDAAAHSIALERLRAAGIGVVTAEMVLFEWLEHADRPELGELVALLK